MKNPITTNEQTAIDLNTCGLPLGPTGRHLIVLRPDGVKSLAKSLQNTAGLRVMSSSDFEGAAVDESGMGDANTLLLENLGLAVVSGEPDQIRSLEMAVTDDSNPVLSIEPELYVIPFSDQLDDDSENGDLVNLLTAGGREYLRGYLDATQALGARLLSGEAGMDAIGVAATFVDTATLTWGLQATKVSTSKYSGSGIRVAVLDTGFDFKHPDFAGRSIISASFVPGAATAQDGHGHGTHCIGTSCGPKTPPPAGTTRRYGIAHKATIMVGKVLSDQGSGQTGWILAGINWAIKNKASIISMSLGSPVSVGQTYSPAYEQAALAALNNNCLIVAAAGNSGQDPTYYPVGSPANCPSILAVAAVGNNLQRASFSCLGVNPNGGEVNIAGPGVSVYSTVPMTKRYAVMSGTSMATPHVAGCAALWAQQSGLRGKALWQKLVGKAQNIAQPAQKVGAGLVQAP